METRGVEKQQSDRRSEIIHGVADVLKRESVRASDMETVVSKAGVSTSEVQQYFGGYNKLLMEMVSDLTESLLIPLNISLSEQSIYSTLHNFGIGLANAYSNSHLVGLYRIALTEATRHVGLGKEFFDRGPGCLTERLAAYFHAGYRSGLIRDGDMKLRADHFLALLRDNLEFSGANPAQDGKAEEAVTDAVEIICTGLAKEAR
jgi:AcrR family transcriptional regulator